jgi:hypothetical protein
MQQSMQQLDIFADTRDVVMRNDVVEHLQRRRAGDARASLTQLASEYPADSALPEMTVLVRELEHGSTLPLIDHTELAALRRCLEDDVIPAAQRVLPAQDVHAWSTPCWRSLAQRAASLVFCGTHTEVTPRRYGFAQGTGRRPLTPSTRSNRGGASRRHLPGRPKRAIERPASMPRGRCWQNWRGWHRHGSQH